MSGVYCYTQCCSCFRMLRLKLLQNTFTRTYAIFKIFKTTNLVLTTRGPFHKSLYERFLLYEFVEHVSKYESNEFVALTNLCEMEPSNPK